jgi:hypothetical protein
MKTKDIIIAVLALLVLTLSILYVNKGSENKEKAQLTEDCEVLPSDSRCVDITERLDSVRSDSFCRNSAAQYGRAFPSVGDSLDTIRKYIRDEKRINSHDQIYGYQLGIKHIRELYQAIEHYNLNNEDSVAGIRLYEAVSTRKIEGKLFRKADLVMVPYLSNGRDAFVVDSTMPIVPNNLKIYTHFRPCPRICGSEELFIHQ